MPNCFKLIWAVIALSIICAGILLPQVCFADNETYESLPPFISADTNANVILVTDFSGSMQGQAYYGLESDGYSFAQIFDYGDKWEVRTDYESSKTYYGYFDSTQYYFYNSGEKYWEIVKKPKFTLPQVGNKDCLSGNFLNFLVTTRIDAVLKSLIGGKAECPAGQNYCILRPQGARRWVKINNLNANCHVRPESWWRGAYLEKDVLITVKNASGTSAIGEFEDRYARVKIDADDRSGIIQKNFSKVRFGFIPYASYTNNTARDGMIKYGVHENDLNKLITALEGTKPYYATNTGEALKETYYYLTQSSRRRLYNKNYIAKGTEKDPYYEKRTDGVIEPAWCRKTYVVLISDGQYSGTDPDSWARKLHIGDLRETDELPNDQNANVFSLFAFSDDIDGEQSMKTVAAFGNYKDISGGTNGTPYTFSVNNGSENNEFPRSSCNPLGTYNPACEEWDSDKDGIPDGFYFASDGQAMAKALSDIFEAIRQGTASGSAVAALSSKASTGNVMAQAAFYPDKEFDHGKRVAWTGDVFGEWYLNAYIPDATGKKQLIQNIREDTVHDYSLKVKEDRIIEYIINNKALTINAYDSNQYGTKADVFADEKYSSIEEVNNLFDCGEQLRIRKPDDRTIYGVDEDDNLIQFTAANKDKFDTLLGNLVSEYPDCLLTSDSPDYEKLINYTRGEPVATCRSRATNSSSSDENVWKIGDIIYSSPTVVEYKNYALIYAGSNDGMLHAFRMGFMKNNRKTLNPANLCDENSTDECTHTKIGKEEWAFIPKDAMPYLRYMAHPNYNHIYAVDLKPFIVNLGSKVILIGGMRFGGGTDAKAEDAIKSPSDTGAIGRSAYYALDITDPLKPQYLWRYAPDGMGFSYSGPAFIKRKDSDGNWHYFILFASGPTTYEGRSSQDLQIFTVDLFTGEEKDVYGDKSNELGIKNAFGGRLFTNGLDINKDGQTDFIFLGYTDNAAGEYKKMKGGVIKIWTGSENPKDWDYKKNYLAFNANPITAPIKVMDCFPGQLSFPFLYFGTGRYFVSNDQTQATKKDVNYLYGVPFNYGADNKPIKGGSSINSCKNASELTCDTLDKINTHPLKSAWKIPLEAANGKYLRERCYSDAATTEYNIVFFDTIRPMGVVCECGGQSRSWALNCASGKAITDVICGEGSDKYVVDEKVQFTYLVQRSGGDIEEHEKGEFKNGATGWKEGVTSEQPGLPASPPGSKLGTLLYWKLW